MKKILITTVLIMLTGCATFNDKMVRVPDLNQATKTESVVEHKVGTFVQKLNGEGVNRGMLSNQSLGEKEIALITNRWKSKGLITDAGVPGELKTTPGYVLTLNGSRNEDGSIMGAILTGLTLYLIPSSATMTTDATFDLLNNKTKKHYQVPVKYGFTTTQWLLFLPATPFIGIGVTNAHDDAADYLYAEFDKQGAFN